MSRQLASHVLQAPMFGPKQAPSTPAGNQASATSMRKALPPHLFQRISILNAKGRHTLQCTWTHIIREEQGPYHGNERTASPSLLLAARARTVADASEGTRRYTGDTLEPMTASSTPIRQRPVYSCFSLSFHLPRILCLSPSLSPRRMPPTRTAVRTWKRKRRWCASVSSSV